MDDKSLFSGGFPGLSPPEKKTTRSKERKDRGFWLRFVSGLVNQREAFLNANNLNLVIRSHEVRDEGYEIEQGGRWLSGRKAHARAQKQRTQKLLVERG